MLRNYLNKPPTTFRGKDNMQFAIGLIFLIIFFCFVYGANVLNERYDNDKTVDTKDDFDVRQW